MLAVHMENHFSVCNDSEKRVSTQTTYCLLNSKPTQTHCTVHWAPECMVGKTCKLPDCSMQCPFRAHPGSGGTDQSVQLRQAQASGHTLPLVGWFLGHRWAGHQVFRGQFFSRTTSHDFGGMREWTCTGIPARWPHILARPK